MTTIGINGHVAGMTPAQFATLPPHMKLQHATRMPNHFLMNNAILSRRQAHRFDLATGAAPHIFHPVHGRGPAPRVAAKRPLNSWMAFRVFYSSIFASLQQKKASSYLTLMWQRDAFKAKWTIIARAYSAIRDQVGKPRAPLDQFLNLVCPELGILDAEDYLQKMSWELEIDVDGVMKLKQVSVPDIASFDDHIKHSSMTQKDVIHFCATEGYISQLTAIAIAGPPEAIQQSILATAPVVSSIPPVAGNNPFLIQTTANPSTAASNILGFDVDQMLGRSEQSESANLQLSPPPAPYQWTGCMADLYHPDEGTFNFESLGNNYGTPLFDTGDISDPQSFETMFGEVIQDGFFRPSIPESQDDLIKPF